MRARCTRLIFPRQQYYMCPMMTPARPSGFSLVSLCVRPPHPTCAHRRTKPPLCIFDPGCADCKVHASVYVSGTCRTLRALQRCSKAHLQTNIETDREVHARRDSIRDTWWPEPRGTNDIVARFVVEPTDEFWRVQVQQEAKEHGDIWLLDKSVRCRTHAS